MTQPTLSFQGGTLVLYGVGQSETVPPVFQWIKARWRCEAYHYPTLVAWLQRQGIHDNVPRWQPLDLTLHDQREPHDYQLEALQAWQAGNQRGSIVLPTGAGKTFVAIHAIQRVNRATLVVAPTIDLLHQWYARLGNAFATAIGVYYGGEKIIKPITVTTYHSAGDLMAAYGNHFKLIIYDEVHHLPAPSWGETALMSPASFRLGLTATYPTQAEQADGRWSLNHLIGPILYEKRIDELAGKQLAAYRTERIRVTLTDTERQQYDADYAIYARFIKERRLYLHGPRWWLELMRLSSLEPKAREAALAHQRLGRLLAASTEKLAALARLLQEHWHAHILIFTESNEVVYHLSQHHLIPALTCETKAAERKELLEGFQQGAYGALVTSKVLNEGIDVPEAKVAIVLGGSAGAREYIQRLGRILRKVDNREAVLYEIVVHDTVDVGRARRRRPRPATA
ncbi:MAG: DEAD/DEAH box helicase family protein [Caldilineaceae bacterium]|nr:DEAD/DEAH box helicase family protein [Caldilineaceae bacterium]